MCFANLHLSLSLPERYPPSCADLIFYSLFFSLFCYLALRTICLAYRDLQGNEDITSKDELGVFSIEKQELTLMGVFGIADVIRPEVPGAVAQCKRAGIKVRMVTGDNLDTARAIAIQCGIMDKDDPNAIAIEGPEFIAKTGGVVCKK